jgi:hypothetical protein
VDDNLSMVLKAVSTERTSFTRATSTGGSTTGAAPNTQGRRPATP